MADAEATLRDGRECRPTFFLLGPSPRMDQLVPVVIPDFAQHRDVHSARLRMACDVLHVQAVASIASTWISMRRVGDLPPGTDVRALMDNARPDILPRNDPDRSHAIVFAWLDRQGDTGVRVIHYRLDTGRPIEIGTWQRLGDGAIPRMLERILGVHTTTIEGEPIPPVSWHVTGRQGPSAGRTPKGGA